MKAVLRDVEHSRSVAIPPHRSGAFGRLHRRFLPIALVILQITLGTPCAHAQEPELEFGFVVGLGSENTEFSHGIAVDGSGNVYTGGYFHGTVDFDPGVGVASRTSAGINAAFIQ